MADPHGGAVYVNNVKAALPTAKDGPRSQMRTVSASVHTKGRDNASMSTRIVDLDTAVAVVRESPKEVGVVDLIALRPAELERKVVDEVLLTPEAGAEGDNWLDRVTAKGDSRPETQLTLMNSRFAKAVTPQGGRIDMAGDQFYVDFDITQSNTPAGTRLRIGDAVIEISEEPHTGCAKFSRRFGRDVLKLTQTDEGRSLRLRGVYARVITPGVVRTGDSMSRVGLDD